VAVLTATTAQAATFFVNTRAGLGANDSVDWAQLGADGTTIPNSFTATSVGGLGISGQFTGSGSGERRTQSSSWGGDFAPGDAVIWAADSNNGVGSGPLTLTFVNSVSAVGTQIASNYYGSFTGSIQAFDSGGNSLGLFAGLTGTTNGNNDNSAIFWGIRSTNADIKSIVFNASDDAANSPNDFAINQLSLVTNSTTDVPEPFTIIGTIVGGTAAVRMRKKLKSANKG
jgi:hypothetical protein